MISRTIAEDLRSFIDDAFLFGQGGMPPDDASFLESGILDSTGVLQLIAFLEEQYGFKVEDAEVVPDNLDSISKVTAYIQSKLLKPENDAEGAAELCGRLKWQASC